MKASQWIQMIWDNIPEAQRIVVGSVVLRVLNSNDWPILEMPAELNLEYDVPLDGATRPSVTERLGVDKDGDSWRRFCYKGWDDISLTNATSFANFLGYELADGTMSPRLEAGMDVRYCVFKKG